MADGFGWRISHNEPSKDWELAEPLLATNSSLVHPERPLSPASTKAGRSFAWTPYASQQHCAVPKKKTTTTIPAVGGRSRSIAGARSGRSSSAWTTKLKRAVAHLAQLLIAISAVVYIFGLLYFFTPLNTLELESVISEWWGLDHFEMVRPTFLTLSCGVPLFFSVVLFEYFRHHNVRRVTSSFLLAIAMVLRRKPRILTWISWFSYGELLFLLFFLGGNVVVFYYGFDRRYQMAILIAGGEPIEFNKYLTMVGVVLGFNCIYNTAFLFLPATRNCAWMELLNISYANGIKYHRWLGVVTVLTAFVHCVCYYWAWLRQGTWQQKALPCFDCDLGTREGAKIWVNVFGELALLCFLAIGLTSIPWVRRKFYNAFYYVHHLFLVAVLFAVLHWRGAIWYMLPTFALYLIHRLVSSSNSFAPVDITEFTTLSSELLKIVVTRSELRSGDFQVGQFVYLNVPSISKLQWHAFTIASSPRMSAHSLTIITKALGDWTNDLVRYSEECKQANEQPTMYMDGYYGSSLEIYEYYATVCLIGGGVGVTPLFAILEDIVAKLSRDATLRQRVYFIFTFRELELLEEVFPLLAKIRELDPHERSFCFHFSLTRVPTDKALDRRMGSRDRLTFKAGTGAAASSPFAEPLQSSTSKSLTYVAVFSATVLLVAWLEFGGGRISKNHTSLWPVQSGAEMLAVCTTALLVCMFVCVERMLRRQSRGPLSNRPGKSLDGRRQQDPFAFTPHLYSSDVHTFRDLIAEFKVSVGRRPDIRVVLRHVHAGHTYQPSAPSPIAVFVSGPESLKSAVGYAAAEIGSSHFDIHEEEFEL